MVKFLWLDINASYSHSSMALPALEAQIVSNISKHIEWSIVSGTIKSNKEEIISQILKHSPDYIFATGWLFNINCLLSILRKTSALLENSRIILGGPEFLGDNSEFLNSFPFVTAVFKGDGEEIFCKMAEIITNDTASMEWLKLPGFEYLEHDSVGKKYICKEIVKTGDFTALKAPEDSKFFNWEKAFVQIETSRGCFNSCRFCVSGIDNSKVTDLPVEKIRERLKKIESKGIKEIRILDRTFNANANRAIELISLFEEFSGKLKFHLEVHPTMINEKLKEKLRNTPQGLLHIEAGIQSLDDGVLSLCQRKGDSTSALNGLKFLLSTQKFEVHTDFIAGLPGYSYNNLMADIRQMMEIRPHEIQLELLKLLPGTYFKKNAGQLGIRYSSEPPYEVLQTDSISFDELHKSMVLSKIIEYWYNDPSWREIFSEIVTDEEDFLYKITDYLAENAFMDHTYSYESKSMILYKFCKERYPGHIAKISLGWISNGLSIKKEPAADLKVWHFDDPSVNNPVFERENICNHYYFFDNKDVRYWFVYNRNISREKPIKLYKEFLSKS